MEAKFPEDQKKNFKNDYSNLIPSATVAYQISPSQNFRLGYNMRIQRPGIFQLNPFEDSSDPNNIRVGNSKLDAVKNHVFNLDYSLFSGRMMFMTSLSYDLQNNGIEQIRTRNNGVYTTTYANIGKRRNLGISAYVNWMPNQKLSIFSNLDGHYIDIQSDLEVDDSRISSNNGFVTNAVIGVQYTLPYNIKAHLNGGYFSRQVTLQGSSSSFLFHSISLMRGFIKNKLQVRLFAQNPFEREKKFKNIMRTDDYHLESLSSYRVQQFGVSVSLNLGRMKSRVKKVERGIVNDDILKIEDNTYNKQVGGAYK